MRYNKLSRYWRITASVTGLIVPLAATTVAYSQPPSPRSEVTESRSSTDQQAPDRSQSDQSEGVEYLTRGPLHEAFAEPYSADPEPSPMVQQQPPEPIDEIPPEYRPDGKDVVWISGYWSWDDERDDFIWVSGVWRDLPPGQEWVPGYWDQTSDGYQYISGFWVSNQLSEVQYLPEPPKSLEQGPSSPAPGEDYFYVPGHWVYETNEYQWQPGFWSVSHSDWVWVPAQYVWTPRGCVHQAGYWDHDVAHRGVLFTPVYYSQPVYRTTGYSYRPRYTIDTSVGLFVHLFVRPSHHHYYFGDYYGSRYSDHYYPWTTRYQSNRHYDPFYASYHNRNGRGGNNNVLSWITNQYQVFANNEQYRPARTIADQRNFLNSNRNSQIDPTILRLSSVGEALDALANNADSGLQQIDNNEVDRIRRSLDPLRKLTRERLSLEGSSVSADAAVRANANLEGNGNSDTSGGDRNANANARAEVNAERRGSLRLPGRDRRASSIGAEVSGIADDVLKGDTPGAASQQTDANRDPRREAAMQRARDAAKRAGNAGQQPRGDARDATESIRERLKQAEDRTRPGIDSAKPAESLRNLDPTRGLQGTRDRGRNGIQGQGGTGGGQSNRPGALRPIRPENWPSQLRRNAERALPERPRLNNVPGNQPGNQPAIQPGNRTPNRGGNANPGRALRGAAESAAPAAQKSIDKATKKGADGVGKAVKDKVKGGRGD